MASNTFALRRLYAGAQAALVRGELKRAAELVVAIEEEAWDVPTTRNWQRRARELRTAIAERQNG